MLPPEVVVWGPSQRPGCGPASPLTAMSLRRPALTVYFAAASGALLVSLAALGSPRTASRAAAAAPTGKQIFLQRCASCHGANGEGTKEYARPLAGKRSVAELVTFISRSMPPGPVKKCTGPDAQKVAAYLYSAFYSPVAQERNQKARVELTHLTVRQYRWTLSDLIGSFRPAVPWGAERGLRGHYFKSREFRENQRVLQRVDPEVRFDWERGTPAPEGFEPHTFSIRWEGSVIPVETGDYEFVVRTEHAIQLWVNDLRQPLIDAGVKSGSDTVFKGSIFLLGGRAYPLRLEFTKATQGVDDTDKLKDRPIEKASLSLEWTPPKRATEVIPQRCLLPVTLPESYVVTTRFPPDDRSRGFERGSTISKEWDDATTEAAFETAGYVSKHLAALSGAGEGGKDRGEKLRAFARQFAERAFRRPLTPEQAQFFVDRHFGLSPEPEIAVKRVLLLVLKSPRFLYPGLGAGDAYDAATRLSFGLWDSLPDAELQKAAAANELSTREQVARQAERMLADPRARAKLREFFLQWLKVDQAPDLAKDANRFPGFDDAAASDLRASLELTLDQIAWSERSDFRDLLLSDKVFLNGRLARFYGVPMPAEASFQPVSLEPGERAGVLTHPYLLASFAYLDSSSPIHRGVLVARSLLGRTLQPPPEAFTPLPASKHPNLTTRQRISLQTQPAACTGCHGMINPLGFTLEKFDAIGRLRTEENGKPIDTTGGYRPLAGKPVRFTGARDLAAYVAASPEAHAAFVEKLFHHVVKQPVRAYGPQALPSLERSFEANQCSIRRQLIETVVVTALHR
jgi:mono/diheme cytochrome c family protein